MGHGELLYFLKTNQEELYYNINFYLLLVAARNCKQYYEVKKELMELLDYSSASYFNKVIKQKSNNTPIYNLSQSSLIKVCEYICSNIPGLTLNSDQLLTKNNQKEIDNYIRLSNITPKSMGLN